MRQVKNGLRQVGEAIKFCHHGGLKIAHLSVAPQYIYITSDGDWKLGGFGFALPLTGEKHLTTAIDFQVIGDGLPGPCVPPMQFSAPELMKVRPDSSPNPGSTRSTNFFLGTLLCGRARCRTVQNWSRPTSSASAGSRSKFSSA